MTDSTKRWLIGGAVAAVLFGPALWNNVTRADQPTRPTYQPATEYDSDYDSPSDGGTSDYSPSDSPSYVDPSDVDCADVGHEVEIDGDDPYYLDADNDGVGCEGW